MPKKEMEVRLKEEKTLFPVRTVSCTADTRFFLLTGLVRSRFEFQMFAAMGIGVLMTFIPLYYYRNGKSFDAMKWKDLLTRVILPSAVLLIPAGVVAYMLLEIAG